MPGVRDIECRIRLNGGTTEMLSAPSEQKMEWRGEDGYAVVRVPSLMIMSILTVLGYSGSGASD